MTVVLTDTNGWPVAAVNASFDVRVYARMSIYSLRPRSDAPTVADDGIVITIDPESN